MSVVLLRLILASFALAVAFAQPRQNEPIVDVVVDLDAVLIYELDSLNLDPSIPKLKPDLTVLKQDYRFSHGIFEFLDFVRSLPRARLSFFSSAHEKRNVGLLSQLRLGDGKSALAAAGLVLSKDNLTPPTSEIFSPQKDLLQLTALPGATLANTILVDDWAINARPGQTANLLLVTPAQPIPANDIANWPVNIPEEAFEQKPDRDWALELYRERNKLPRVAALLTIAISEAERNGTSVSEALKRQQFDENGAYRYEATTTAEIYLLGEELLRKVNPSFKLMRPDCEPLLVNR